MRLVLKRSSDCCGILRKEINARCAACHPKIGQVWHNGGEDVGANGCQGIQCCENSEKDKLHYQEL
jgi:hypothetical protein